MNIFIRVTGEKKYFIPIFVLILGSFLASSANIFSNPAAAEKGDAKRGYEVFMDNCTPCHGEDGDGQGPLGPQVGARDFTKGIFEKGDTLEELFDTISNGIPPKMPTWKKKLPEQDRRDAAAYILRSFVKKK